MTNPDRVYNFLRDHRTDGFCNDCLERQTGINRHEVNTIANTLGLFRINLLEEVASVRNTAATEKSCSRFTSSQNSA